MRANIFQLLTSILFLSQWTFQQTNTSSLRVFDWMSIVCVSERRRVHSPAAEGPTTHIRSCDVELRPLIRGSESGSVLTQQLHYTNQTNAKTKTITLSLLFFPVFFCDRLIGSFLIPRLCSSLELRIMIMRLTKSKWPHFRSVFFFRPRYLFS